MTASLYHKGSLVRVEGSRRAMSKTSRPGDAPDGERHFGGVEPETLDLALPGEAVAAHQVLGVEPGVVGEAEAPERNFDIGLVGAVGVEIDGDEHDIVACRRRLLEEEDVVVPGDQDGEAEMRVQRRIGPADAVQ